MTDAEKAEKLLLGDVCSECGDPYEEQTDGYVGLCPVCKKKKEEERRLRDEREKAENRKHLRPGEMLADDYFKAIYGKHLELWEWTFLCEIFIIFNWGTYTRPLTRKIQKEWWYIKGRKRSNSRWRLSGFDRRFVQKMISNLVRCGIFTIEDDIWAFKGFPKGWERKWRKVHLPA
jgi:hypothetical protein